jgi:hypothetical protein
MEGRLWLSDHGFAYVESIDGGGAVFSRRSAFRDQDSTPGLRIRSRRTDYNAFPPFDLPHVVKAEKH